MRNNKIQKEKMGTGVSGKIIKNFKKKIRMKFSNIKFSIEIKQNF